MAVRNGQKRRQPDERGAAVSGPAAGPSAGGAGQPVALAGASTAACAMAKADATSPFPWGPIIVMCICSFATCINQTMMQPIGPFYSASVLCYHMRRHQQPRAPSAGTDCGPCQIEPASTEPPSID